ncbi:hypothetical protein [Chitinophaga defluvii]|uniref:Uncharacterized protein n=1 Tax=Chitinophaga defluvii TaxID=3163343 RepID=A0ABV2T7P1_9BACT
MRSFFAFLACAGFITWAHSCDKKMFGVQAGLTDQQPAPERYTPPAGTVLAAAFTPIRMHGHTIVPIDPVQVQELVPTVNLTMSPVATKQMILRRKLATAVPLKVNMKKRARRMTNDSLLILPYLHASLSSTHLLQY